MNINERLESGEINSALYGDLQYKEKKTFTILPSYKIWNADPREPSAPQTPGIVMTTSKKEGENYVREKQIVPEIDAVILFTSHGRKLGRGTGKQYQVVCQSHNGVNPSLRIDSPLCRKTTATDVAKIFAQWKGFDEAKIKAKVGEVVEGSQSLQVCSLKSANGFISLCPYSKKDEVTGTKASCKQHIFVHGYDKTHKREFKMELTGGSISYGKFIAPFHEFFKYLRTAGKNNGPMPSFAFTVKLSPLVNGGFNILNVTNHQLITDEAELSSMEEKANAALESYNREAHRLSKEAYEKSKQATSSSGSPAEAQEDTGIKEEDIPFVSFDED